MKNLAPSLLLFFTMFFNAGSACAQGFLKTDGKRIVNERGENILLRGFGLGGWMLQEGYMLRIYNEGQQYRLRERIDSLIGKERADEFYDSWLSNHTTKVDIDSLKAWGFNSVRLPMHYNLYTLPADKEPVAGQQTWLEKGLALTDSLVSWCKSNGIYLILDLHAAPGGQGNDLNIADRDPSKPSLWQSEINQQKTIALWRKLAERYKNETIIAAYDIINEPNWGFTDLVNDKNGTKEQKNEPLKKLMKDITKTIREVDPHHIVIIEGNGWGNNYKGIFDEGLWDKNMVLSFHKYWNFNDDQSIEHILKYRDQYNVPVWLGETGENSNVWFTDAIRLLESHNIGWAWWPLKKLGSNNPLQVKSNVNYDNLVAYWNGKSEKPPKEKDAYDGLLSLAAATNIQSNIIHPDVIDAMIRQPFSDDSKPFAPNKISNGAVLRAAAYDMGKNGFAYFDNDTANYWVSGKRSVGNRGGIYRNDGVDIFSDSSAHESFYIGSIEDGEWLQYTIDVVEAANYKLEFMVATGGSGGSISVTDKRNFIAGEITVPASRNKKWKTLTLKNFNLDTGLHTLRVAFPKGGFNLLKIRFLK